MKKILLVPFVLLLIFGTVQSRNQKKKLKPSFFGELKAREIGPAVMSGRISAIDASHNNPLLVYVGSAGGGVWKTKNGGTTFKPVFDEHVQSIGAIAIDQKHNDTVWVGTGEAWTRNSVSVGKGVFKTTNGGEDWSFMGLKGTDNIADIVINPDNSNEVFVAALGNIWKSNSERGVFKTSDGGRTWKKVLFVDENTGCSDLAIDPSNPNILFAGMWDFRRKPYTFRSGGPGSGLYKSTDGGETWEKITGGLPQGELGRIAVAISPVNTNIVYALIEAKESALYRSLDKGRTWEKRSASGIVGERPFYFSAIVPDPLDTNRFYKPGFTLYVSDDGGYSYTSPFVEGGRVHSDIHAVWVNPNNNRHLYIGTDGGFYISHDQGSTWQHAQNLPVAQFYHISVDNEEPYNVYGGLQDNGSWIGKSQGINGITNCDWENVGYGDGFTVLPDPADKNILYWLYQGGQLMRFYKDTREIKEIKPFSDDPDVKLRFNWDTPVYFSPTQEGVLYIGAQFLYRTDNRGDSWEKISPDLTTNDPEKQKQEESGGLTIDNSTAENHCTIYTISESPKDKNVIWVGTDDGNLQITVDGGKTWNNVVKNIPGLPANTWCAKVAACNFKRETAYVVFDGHRNGDKSVYVYKTTDLGKTWKSLASENIEGYARTILEDSVNPELLFLGTEFGLYISIDGGEQWVRFKNKVPKVAIYEMVLQPQTSDLVLGTHGRGVLIIDDISPLRLLNEKVLNSKVHIFPVKPYYISNPKFSYGISGDQEFFGSNPSAAVTINYYMKKRHIFGDMRIEIYNERGKLVKTLPAGKRKGINRVSWYVRKKPPKVKASSPNLAFRTAFGPTFPPGKYTVKIIEGKNEYSAPVEIKYPKTERHSIADMELQYKILNKAYVLLEDISFKDKQITNLLRKIKNIKVLSNENSGEFMGELEKIHKTLVSTSPYIISGQIRLAEKVADVYSGIINYLGRPTKSQIERLELLEKEFKRISKETDKLIEKKLPEINRLLQKQGLKTIELLTREQYDKS